MRCDISKKKAATGTLEDLIEVITCELSPLVSAKIAPSSISQARVVSSTEFY
jgi:hypothetical protein